MRSGRSNNSLIEQLAVLSLAALTLAGASCDSRSDADGAADQVVVAHATASSPAASAPPPLPRPAPTADSPLAPFRTDLLDLAFDTATLIPIDPHIKDRSRSQEQVVNASIALNQPTRALAAIERIDNWRRGTAYAALALALAQHGASTAIQIHLDRANEIADGTEGWQRDRIRVGIAKVHATLGDNARAAAFEAGVTNSDLGKVHAMRARHGGDEGVAQEMRELDALIATGDFDLTRNAMEAYGELHRRTYGDAFRRSEIEARIKNSWSTLPVPIRIELTMTMAQSAIAHGDHAKANALIDEAVAMLADLGSAPEDRIAFMGRVAALRAAAGDMERARSEADNAIVAFDAERNKIPDIYRAGALRPVAEAFKAIGDRQRTLDVFRRVVEEGAVNPNARPRAEDLSATCISLAMHDVEPDAALWARLRKIRGELVAPW